MIITVFLHIPPRPCEAINVDNRQLYFLALSRASAFARGFKGLARKRGGGFHRDITDTSRTNEERYDGSSRRQSGRRSEEHTSELQSLMRISYAVFCLTKKKKQPKHQHQ